jgi:hypothetical protein
MVFFSCKEKAKQRKKRKMIVSNNTTTFKWKKRQWSIQGDGGRPDLITEGC